MGRQIYPSSNPTGFGINRDTDKLVVTPGICAGMTAVWCLKMGIGLKLESTAPGVADATAIQFSYELYNKNLAFLTKEFLPSARLRLVEENVWKGTGRSTAASVIQNGNGKVYFWGYTGHAIGVARRDDKYYVFDPDRGLEELLSTTEFKQHIEKDYAKYIKDDGWTLVQVEPDPKQLHLVVPPKGK